MLRSVLNRAARPRRLMLAALCVAIAGAVAPQAGAADITVQLDQAKLEKLAERTSTIVIGNPLIADALIQPGGMMVITGKGYGTTNLVMLDRSGQILAQKMIEVRGPAGQTIVVYRGVDRETYSCTPTCERRITLGDGPDFFTATLTQTGARNGQAVGAATAK